MLYGRCGQLSKGDDKFVQTYLDQMQALEDKSQMLFLYT